ncbi:MAG: S-layer homology domain-containing protein, partial [Flavonifractor sp.]|nr:S-layer homology domain-containing protein [Flavonifractor sp.]
PASSRGTLYYKYDSDKPAEVKESTSYYRSGSGRLLDDITFVSNSNFAGTVEISYTGYSSGSGQFSGSVLITVAAPRAETIYLTAGSAPIQLSSAAFRQACGTVLTQGLSYVRFTSLPDTRAGRLYENYMDAASGYQASTGSPYYLTGSPGIDQLTFVPQSGYQGTATINYTGYGAGGDQVSGTVEIAVSNGGSGGINIPAVSSFSDMANYSWATAAVEYLSQTGVVNGIGNGRFGPEQTIQRCDFTLMLCRAFRFDMIGGNSFPDIPAGSYYGSAVTTAKSLGIVTGSNGLFMPTSALSRQDAMLMLKRAMVAAGWSVPSGAEGSLSRFSDGAQVSGYARDAVASMVQMGVVTGDGANRLKPWEPISRAEMAVILYRVLAR